MNLFTNQLIINIIFFLRLYQAIINEKLADLFGSHAVYIFKIVFSQRSLASETAHVFPLLVWPIIDALSYLIGSHLMNTGAQLLHSLLLHSFLLIVLNLLQPGLFFFRQIFFIHVLFLIECVDQDGKEKVEQDEITDEDP